MKHYCDGCNSGSLREEDHIRYWCCGGDSVCDAVEDEPTCTDPDGHKWTREGCGDGMWSLGGTAFEFQKRCRLCGIVEFRTEYGSQRSPGECDSVCYERGEPDPTEDEEKEN
jgi:hypothetical protein